MKNDGGSAFPYPTMCGKVILGMSLRDWFAGQALASLELRPHSGWIAEDFTLVAAWCRKLADAMLKEREKE